MPEYRPRAGSHSADAGDARGERERLLGPDPVGHGNCSAIGPDGGGCTGTLPVLAPLMKLGVGLGLIDEVPDVVADPPPNEAR